MGKLVGPDFAAVALRGLAFGMILPLYVAHMQSLGITLLQIGLLGTIFEAFKFVFEIPLGALSDRIGEKKALIVSSLILTFAFIGLAFAHDFKMLIAIMFLWSIGEAFFSGTFESWVSHREGPLRFQSRYSNSVQIYTVTVIVGAFVAYILQSLYPPLPFLVAGLLFLFELFIYTTAEFPKHLDREQEINSVALSLRNAITFSFKNVSVVRILCISFITEFVYDGMNQYWQPAIVDFELSKWLGPLYGMASLLSIFMIRVIGRWGKSHRQSSHLILFFESLGLICFVLTAAAETKWILVPIIILLALGSPRNVYLKSFLNEHFPSGKKATLFSIFSGVGAFGEILAGASFGLIAKFFGIATVFWVGAILLIPVLGIYISMLPSKKVEKDIAPCVE